MTDAPLGSEFLRTVARFFVRGTVFGALAGALVGLVLGLIAYPPTAWAAAIEIGLPAAAAGAVVGLIVGVAVAARRRVHAHRDHDNEPELGPTHQS